MFRKTPRNLRIFSKNRHFGGKARDLRVTQNRENGVILGHFIDFPGFKTLIFWGKMSVRGITRRGSTNSID